MLAQEEGISVWEAERQLNADAFLDEYPWWECHGLHCLFLLYRMFLHAVATGRKEYDQAIFQGWWQPMPEQDLEAEPSAIELIGPGFIREEIRKVYNDVYQLWRSPQKSPFEAKMEESVCQEILNSIKECLWHRQESDQPQGRLGQSPASASRPDLWAKFQDSVCAMYDHFRDLKEGALVAATLLEDKIERLSLDCWWSGSHRQSGSDWYRSQSAGHPLQVPQVASHHGGSVRLAELPSPSRSRQWVTFAELSLDSSPERDAGLGEPYPPTWSEWGLGNPSNWSRTEEDLECLPPLNPYVEGFLARAEGGDDSQQTPWPEPPNNSSEWVKWHAEQLNTPAWWQELSQGPWPEGCWGVCEAGLGSVQLSKVSSHAQEVTNDYSALLTLTLWTGTNFCPFPLWSLVDRTTN